MASIQVLHSEHWPWPSPNKSLEKGPDLTWMQALSPCVRQQYTRLHINLRETQPRKRDELWVKHYTSSGLTGKSVLHILYLLRDSKLAELGWCACSSRSQGQKKTASLSHALNPAWHKVVQRPFLVAHREYSGRSHLTETAGSAVGQYGH